MATQTVPFATAFDAAVVFQYEYDDTTGTVLSLDCVNALDVPVWAQITVGSKTGNKTFAPGTTTFSVPANIGARITDFTNLLGNYVLATRAPA